MGSVVVGGLLFGCVFAKGGHETMYEEGLEAINHVLSERNDLRLENVSLRGRIQLLEGVQKKLAKLIAGQGAPSEEALALVEKVALLKQELQKLVSPEGQIQEATVDELIERLSALSQKLHTNFVNSDGSQQVGVLEAVQQVASLQKELEALFPPAEGEKPVSISQAIQKISNLQKELDTIFPEDGQSQGEDIIEKLQKFSALKQELDNLLVTDSDGGEVTMTEAVEKFNEFKKELIDLFPGPGSDLNSRIKNKIAQYERDILGKEKTLRKIRKEAKDLKKELKKVTELFVEIVRYVKDNRE
jgi:hypothetical protein